MQAAASADPLSIPFAAKPSIEPIVIPLDNLPARIEPHRHVSQVGDQFHLTG
jgi:hypothetical protein